MRAPKGVGDAWCQPCHSDYHREWMKDPENRESLRQRRFEQERLNPALVKFRQVRARAKQRGIPFNARVEDFIVPETCPVLGVPLRREYGTGKANGDSPSVDRVIPALGYVTGNIRIISNRANLLKNDASLDELKNLVSYVEGHLRLRHPASSEPDT